jgi:hypothetical protein
MAGNGYYDRFAAQYLPKSVETWDDYTGSSAGDDWDSLTTWEGTPVLPLTFTTEVVDYGSSELLNYIATVDANFPVDIDVLYGETVDSAGGDIDSPTTISVTPSSSLTAAKARYWQFAISITRDSAGEATPRIEDVNVSLSAETLQRTVTDIDSSTLSGSVGVRQLAALQGIGTVSSIITQVHLPVGAPYVEDTYVASGYFETADAGTETPYIFVNKATTPPTLNIYDIDTYGKRKLVDCTFDALAVGLPALTSDSLGNIKETN